MSSKFIVQFCVVTTLAIGLAHAATADSITNGDFSTGDLSGWTVFTTNGPGSNGPGYPTVSSFNVTGAGSQNAAEFEDGNDPGVQSGGGLTQAVTITDGGLETFTADVAASGGDQDGSDFSLLVNGVSIASWDTGPISSGTDRDVLSGTYDFTTPGTYDLSVLVTRAAVSGVPREYVTNISLTATPEPSSVTGLAAGLIILSGMLLVRRRSLKISN